MRTPQQKQVEQRKQTTAREFNVPIVPLDLLEYLEGTYYSTPLLDSNPHSVDSALKLAGAILLVEDLRAAYEEQALENNVDRAIAEGIQSPDTGVQF